MYIYMAYCTYCFIVGVLLQSKFGLDQQDSELNCLCVRKFCFSSSAGVAWASVSNFHTEKNDYWFLLSKPESDCVYQYSIELVPNGIPFSSNSIRKLKILSDTGYLNTNQKSFFLRVPACLFLITNITAMNHDDDIYIYTCLIYIYIYVWYLCIYDI